MDGTDSEGSATGRRLLPGWVDEWCPEEIAAELPLVADHMRDPDEVLTQGALHVMVPTRFSFARTLIDRMTECRWEIEKVHESIDANGTGTVGYEIEAEGHTMSFMAFAYEAMPVDQVSMFRDTRTDYLGVLARGPLDLGFMAAERAEFDAQLWRGRAQKGVYGWTIARRGGAFEAVVQGLAAGRQPTEDEVLGRGGYLLRNGGFYGNGRIGSTSWESYAHDSGWLESPYHVDLLALYMWRLVAFDIAEAAARARNSGAAVLEPAVKRFIGVGNSSGLGTMAALVRWPVRLSGYLLPREIALAYVKTRPWPLSHGVVERVMALLQRAARAYDTAPDPGEGLVEPRKHVAAGLRAIAGRIQHHLAAAPDAQREGSMAWLEVSESAGDSVSTEARELFHSFLIEAYPETAGLARLTLAACKRTPEVQPAMSLLELRNEIEARFGWALKVDFGSPAARHYFWYRSEENGENRRGERSVDLGVERETFMDVAGTVRRLYDVIGCLPGQMTVGRLLLEEPEHRLAVWRVQVAANAPYGELREPVCSANFQASDGIRGFLSVLGLEMAAPASNRWVRGVFFRGAPLPDTIRRGETEDWLFPTLTEETR